MTDDVNYRFAGVTRSVPDYLLRRVILWPLTRRRCFQRGAVYRDVKEVMELWRRRLHQLREREWDSLLEDRDYIKARNCAPVCVKVFGHKARTWCNLRSICPWCYGRDVVNDYEVLAKHLPVRGYDGRPLRLLTVTASRLVSPRVAGEVLSSHLQAWREGPISIINRLRPKGSLYRINLDPGTTPNGKACWRLSYRILALVSPTSALPDKLPSVARVLDSKVTSRHELLKPLSRLCRYPTGLLRGDSRLVLKALYARSGLRCKATTGCLRASRGKQL